MGLFSIFRKNKQEPDSDEGAFLSRAEEESNAIRGRGKRQRGEKPADPVLPEKKRARRRLVGAIALVLAMIIGLPMILDSEPKPLADDIAIQIPSKDKPVPTATPGPSAPSAAASASMQQERAEVTPASASASAAAASPAASMAKEADQAPPPAPDKAASASASASAITAKLASLAPEAKPGAKTEAAAKPAAKTDETARAMAILEGKPDPAPSGKADPKPDKFVIQVAALATQEKVDQLRGKLNDAGIKSYTQKVATGKGPRIRVRVGPFGSKDEAEKARAKLSKLGLKGTLVPGAAH